MSSSLRCDIVAVVTEAVSMLMWLPRERQRISGWPLRSAITFAPAHREGWLARSRGGVYASRWQVLVVFASDVGRGVRSRGWCGGFMHTCQEQRVQ